MSYKSTDDLLEEIKDLEVKCFDLTLSPVFTQITDPQCRDKVNRLCASVQELVRTTAQLHADLTCGEELPRIWQR